MTLPKLKPKTRSWLVLLLLSLAGGVIVRILLNSSYSGTALVYLGMPWLVAVALALSTHFDGDPEESLDGTGGSWIVRGSLIVMLGSSFLLGEGFVCVLMFLPIYLLMVAVVAGTYHVTKMLSDDDSKLQRIHLLPLLIGLFALEGTHPNLSFERQGSVAVAQVTSVDKEQLWANLREPMVLNRSRSGGLSTLFPQPVRIDIDTFAVGAVHKVHYRYARWLWTNVHEGTLELRVTESTSNTITAEVVSNSSYLANYLDIERLRLTITEQPGGFSKVTLNIDYRRTLDPAWYFAPLIRLALKGTASHIIETHFLRKEKIPAPLATQ